jgi:hypothetical protein
VIASANAAALSAEAAQPANRRPDIRSIGVPYKKLTMGRLDAHQHAAFKRNHDKVTFAPRPGDVGDAVVAPLIG